MRILTIENTMYDMAQLPNEVDDLRYFVLDYSNPADADFLAIPLIFLESGVNRPVADLKIGKYRVQMPLDWSIVIADKNLGNLEIIELMHLNDRPFEAFMFNPINGYIPEFGEITIDNIFPDVNWNIPKLKHGHILAVPLENKHCPICAFFVKDTNKLSDVLDITKIF